MPTAILWSRQNTIILYPQHSPRLWDILGARATHANPPLLLPIQVVARGQECVPRWLSKSCAMSWAAYQYPSCVESLLLRIIVPSSGRALLTVGKDVLGGSVGLRVVGLTVGQGTGLGVLLLLLAGAKVGRTVSPSSERAPLTVGKGDVRGCFVGLCVVGLTAGLRIGLVASIGAGVAGTGAVVGAGVASVGAGVPGTGAVVGVGVAHIGAGVPSTGAVVLGAGVASIGAGVPGTTNTFLFVPMFD